MAEEVTCRVFECELEATVVHCDNQSGIRLSENPVFHDRSKHIDIRYHFLRDCVHMGTIKLEYIQTDEQVVDIFTKALCKQSFVKFRDKLGLLPNPFLVERECYTSSNKEGIPACMCSCMQKT